MIAAMRERMPGGRRPRRPSVPLIYRFHLYAPGLDDRQWLLSKGRNKTRDGFDLIFTDFEQTGSMTKTLTTDIQRKNAERQLFGARRALSHLVELYDSGQWRLLYREDTFAEAVRSARQAVEHWTDVIAKSEVAANSDAD